MTHYERPIPLADNERCRMLLARLRRGPASTLELQQELPLVHVARQVWELRHWYRYRVATSRAANRTAIYTLLDSPGAEPDGGMPIEQFLMFLDLAS